MKAEVEGSSPAWEKRSGASDTMSINLSPWPYNGSKALTEQDKVDASELLGRLEPAAPQRARECRFLEDVVRLYDEVKAMLGLSLHVRMQI